MAHDSISDPSYVERGQRHTVKAQSNAKEKPNEDTMLSSLHVTHFCLHSRFYKIGCKRSKLNANLAVGLPDILASTSDTGTELIEYLSIVYRNTKNHEVRNSL